MRILLAALALLLLPLAARPAAAQEAFPNFAATTSACNTTWGGVYVVCPSGVAATDYGTISNGLTYASSHNIPLWLKDGTWNVCQQVTIPAGVSVRGSARINNFFYFNSGFSIPPGPVLDCTGTPSFTSGQAHFVLSALSSIEGVDIIGLGNSTTLVDCVQAKNIQEAYVAHVNCQQPSGNGFYLFSNSSSTPTQAIILRDDYVSNAQGCGLFATISGSGIVNDNQAYGFWSNSSGYGSTCQGEIYEDFGVVNLHHVRAEDSNGFGLELRGIGANISGCEINNNEINLIFDTAAASTITGCSFNSGGFHGAPAGVVKFLNGSSGIVMSGNSFGPNPGGSTQTVDVWISAGTPTCTHCFIYDVPTAAQANVSGSLTDGTTTTNLLSGIQLAWQ